MLQGPQPSALGDVSRLSTPPRAQASAETSQSFSLTLGHGIPAAPPQDVLQALDRVQRVAQELQARGLGVHFDVGENKQVSVQVVDAGGSVVREIPVVQALDLFAGENASGAAVA